SRGVSTAGELSDIANVPRSRSYDVLESLEKKGFIIMKIGKPIKYVAIPPSEVLERVKKKIKEDMDRQQKYLEELRGSDMLNELTLLHNKGVDLIEPADLSGSLKGRDNIYDHMELLIKEAEKSIILVTSTEGLLRKHEALKRSLKKASDRGVTIHIAAPLTKECDPVVKELKGIAEIRNINLNARFCIVDAEQLLFMVMSDKEVHPGYDVGIWVNTKLFANALAELFSMVWKQAKAK
ncbi:TrmB family transcriptional regulator, partial [Candidatus Woesearchaeota archaeon]